MRRLRPLYIQVLLGIVAGGVIGALWPDFGVSLRPLGDGFVKLVKMVVAPIIFCTVVSGLAGIGDLRRVGRVGLKALLYFEAITTVALVIGLLVANVVKPGAGFSGGNSVAAQTAVSEYAKSAGTTSGWDTVLHLIPNTFVGAFAEGDLLQVLLLAILAGIALAKLGPKAAAVTEFIHQVSAGFFGIVDVVTRFAPLAAAGAMAFTIGKYGIGTLVQLGSLLLCVYATCAFVVVVVIGAVLRLCGFSLRRVVRYIREELLIVLGTSSSETALPGLMRKLETAGCAPSVVGIVVPAGYSFNLDGTCIYLTLAALFVAQATNTSLTLGEQLGLLGVLLLTSKGAAGVTGSGFVTLAATLAATHKVPVAGMALILGVDRFMSTARALTNFIGNAAAALIVAKWDRAFDPIAGAHLLAGPSAAPGDVPASLPLCHEERVR
jgi:aerobic C4-dicarboxylate transport protein